MDGNTPRPSPPASIVLLCYNKLELTRTCFQALRRNTPAELYELILFDNASSDGTLEFLKQCAATSPNIRVVTTPDNLGYVGGNNAAAAGARGEHLVLLSNDTEPQPGWLENLLALAQAPDVGVVGAKLIFPDGRLQEAGGIIFSDAHGWNFGRGQDPADPQFNFVRDVDYCSGACLLVKRQLFQSLGGLDPLFYPAYYEDTDLCFAARKAGWRVLYQPASTVIHHEGGTNGTDVQTGFKRYQVVNREKFARKWAAELARQHPNDPDAVVAASDRRRGRNLLVIDPFLPMYDRSAGSRRLHDLLHLLVAAGHRVTFIARNGCGAEQYVPALRQAGMEVYAGDPERMRELGHEPTGPRLDLEALLRRKRFHLAILSFWSLAETYLPLLNRFSPTTKVLVDTVDVHYVRELREARLHGDEAGVEQALARKRRELRVYAQADELIVVTPADAAALRAELPRASLRTVPILQAVQENPPPFEDRRGLLFVGGFSHSPNVDAVLYFHREIWPRIQARAPGIHWTIVGNAPPPAVRQLAGPGITVTGYVPDTLPYLEAHRLSIAPLRYGAGMKGKILEALASGLPVVTSSMGAEGLAHYERFLATADTPEGFADAVCALYDDPARWTECARLGRAYIQARYAPAAVAPAVNALVEDGSLTSILILAWNGLEDTQACLDSIRRCTEGDYELILVDNGSTDGTTEYFKEYVRQEPRARLIVNARNRGFAAGNNQALSLARGDYVVFLNNDTVVTAGWLPDLQAALRRDPALGIVGPVSNYVAGRQRVADPGYTSLGELPRFAADWKAAHRGEFEEVSRVIGFCLLASRKVIDAIGGFDPGFINGNFEDDDFCLRAGLAGFKVGIARDVFIHHTGSKTFRGAGLNYERNLRENWETFKARWGLPPEAPLPGGYAGADLRRTAPLRLPLPAVAGPFRPDNPARVWTDPAWTPGSLKQAGLPDCALKGHPQAARQALDAGEWAKAWRAGLEAVTERPYNPEAFLLLADTAFRAGDHVVAKACAERARAFAPGWKAARKFLRGKLTNLRRAPDWLRLPTSLAEPGEGSRLTVCLIARNEERFLGQCLQSVRELADQIVVIDTGSTDRTVEIARAHGAEVHAFAWCDDFSAARNRALEHARGDWVLMLDADEVLPVESHAAVRGLMRTPEVMAWRLRLVNHGREDEGCGYVPRLFRNAPLLFYVWRVHEQVFPSIELRCRDWGLQTRLADSATLVHFGYEASVVRDRQKVRRNLELLELAVQEHPEASYLWMNYGLELSRSGQAQFGLEQFLRAVRLMAEMPRDQIVPETREAVLTHAASHLLAAGRAADVVAVLTSDFARSGTLSASLHFTLGSAYARLGDYATALAHMSQCLELRDQPSLTPSHPEIRGAAPHHYLALCHARLGRNEEALRSFERALRADAKSRPVRMDYARHLFDTGQGETALQRLYELVTEDSSDAAAWKLGGQIALSAPHFLEVARDWTAEAHARHPGNAAITSQRAESLLLSGLCDEALPLWSSLPGSHRATHRAARLLCQAVAGRLGEAAGESEEKAVSLELVRWCQKLIRFGAEPVVRSLDQNLPALRRILPSAVAILEPAMAEAAA